MKKQYTFEESINSQLNYAYSINYTVLENLNHLLPKNGQMVFTSEDIFGKKSEEQQKYDNRFHILASHRNENFNTIRDMFSSLGFEDSFQKHSHNFVDSYQKNLNKPLKYSSLFSKDDIKNWGLLYDINNEIINNIGNTDINYAELDSAYYNFLDFYDKYRNWKSTKEIFEVLDKDINPCGSKSIYYGIIDNPDILKVSIDDFNDFFDNVYGYIDIAETAIYDRMKELEKVKNDPNSTEEFKQLCMILSQISRINRIYDKFGERYEAANKSILKTKQTLLNRIIFGKKKEDETEEPFTINEFHVHKNELRELSELLSIFPELDEEREQLDKLINQTPQANEMAERE